jgi:hypothetical protein
MSATANLPCTHYRGHSETGGLCIWSVIVYGAKNKEYQEAIRKIERLVKDSRASS